MPFPRFLFAAALAALVALPGSALSQSRDPGEPAPVGRRDAVERRPLSRDALRNATPTPMPELSEEEMRALFGGRLPETRTTPEAQPLSSGNVSKKPLRWAGKLYHDLGGGRYSSCTAQFIDDNIIVTAAHCVVLDNGYAGPLEFYLQYDEGDYSAFYPIANGRYYSGWLSGGTGRWQWDYAILCTATNSQTGHFGWRTKWAKAYKQATAIGYPSAIKSGEVIQVVSGKLETYDPFAHVYELNQGDPKFTQGASGGAWIGGYSPRGGKNEVISVNSFLFANAKGRMYGPYLDENFSRLLKQVKALPGC